jgi:hypothetical protein
MTWTRPARYLGTAAVAGIAAYASYGHMRGVAHAHGESAQVAALLPLSVDGMMAVAAVTMLDDKRAGRPTTRWAWVGFLAGVLASLAANISHADPDLIARMVAAWPPLALVVTVEMLARGTQPRQVADELSAVVEPEPAENRPAQSAAERPGRPGRTSGPALTPLPGGRRESIPTHVLAELARHERIPGGRVAEIARRHGVAERTVRRAVARHRQSYAQASLNGNVP